MGYMVIRYVTSRAEAWGRVAGASQRAGGAEELVMRGNDPIPRIRSSVLAEMGAGFAVIFNSGHDRRSTVAHRYINGK